MKSVKALIYIGVAVFIVPFLGIPRAWRTWIVALLGVVVVVLAYRLLRGMAKPGRGISQPVYTENGAEHEDTSDIPQEPKKVTVTEQ